MFVWSTWCTKMYICRFLEIQNFLQHISMTSGYFVNYYTKRPLKDVEMYLHFFLKCEQSKRHFAGSLASRKNSQLWILELLVKLRMEPTHVNINRLKFKWTTSGCDKWFIVRHITYDLTPSDSFSALKYWFMLIN